MNKIPVLDKGYVALYSCSIDREQLLEIKKRFFKGKMCQNFLNTPRIHMEIKCPLFVQLSMSQQLSCTPLSKGKLEAYIPSVNDIAAKDLETSEQISLDIARTTEALLINPSAYRMDGCDNFISQIISPISVYNTLLVSGSLNKWVNFISDDSSPLTIQQFKIAIKNALLSEYDFLWELFSEKKQKQARNRERVSNKN